MKNLSKEVESRAVGMTALSFFENVDFSVYDLVNNKVSIEVERRFDFCGLFCEVLAAQVDKNFENENYIG